MKTVHGWAYPDLDEFMSGEMKEDGTYQASHLRIALSHVTDRSVAIDGGAHVGTWTLLMAADFARVIAVEPSTDTFDALRMNTERADHVERKRLALGDHTWRGSMQLDARGVALKNTGARFVMLDPTGNVPVETIDSWRLPALGFLKLDVEGSEVAALRGARETIARCRPIVLFEDKGLWKRYGEPRDSPQQFLLTLGYQSLARVSSDAIWGPQ